MGSIFSEPMLLHGSNPNLRLTLTTVFNYKSALKFFYWAEFAKVKNDEP